MRTDLDLDLRQHNHLSAVFLLLVFGLEQLLVGPVPLSNQRCSVLSTDQQMVYDLDLVVSDILQEGIENHALRAGSRVLKCLFFARPHELGLCFEDLDVEPLDSEHHVTKHESSGSHLPFNLPT